MEPLLLYTLLLVPPQPLLLKLYIPLALLILNAQITTLLTTA